MNMLGTRAILEEISKRSISLKTLVTGLHPSALPERTMREERQISFVRARDFIPLQN